MIAHIETYKPEQSHYTLYSVVHAPSINYAFHMEFAPPALNQHVDFYWKKKHDTAWRANEEKEKQKHTPCW